MALRPGSRRDLGVIAGAIGVAALLYPRALLRGESFFERDLHLDWYPRLFAIARCLRQGAWPLWDPSIGFGQPLLADPGTQTAYPLAWPALFVPLSFAYTLFVLIHLVVAALGTDRLARRLGAGRSGALAAAGIFLLSGPLQSSVNLWHHFAGACWMPWVILRAERTLRGPTLRGVAALALVAGLQVLAGSADLCAMTWLVAGAWSALRISSLRAGSRLRPATALLVAVTLAAGIGAVAWLPAADVLSRSSRRDLPADVRSAWSVPASGLLRVVAPLDPARVAFDPAAWRRLYDRPDAPLLYSLYVGVPILSLALLPLGSRRLRRRGAFLVAWAAVAAGLAMGPHGPIYDALVALLPLFRVFRYPSKAMLPFALAVALAAGLAVGLLARRRVGQRWLASIAAVSALGGLAAALCASAFLPWAALVALPALACAGLLLLSRRCVARRQMAALLASICAAELLIVHAQLNATAPGWVVFAPPPTVARVDRALGRRLYVYDYHTIPGTAERLLGRADPYRSAAPPPGVDARVFATTAVRQYLPPPSAGLFGLDGSYDLDIRGLYPRDLNDLTHALRLFEGTPVHARMLRMGAVGTVLSLHRAGLEDLRLEGELPSLFPEPILVWRVPAAQPRAWMVGCSRVADRGDAFRVLADPDFDPAQQVILPSRAGPDAGCGVAGSVRIVSFRPDRIRLEAEAPRGGYLVLADAWDPGWKVALDGRTAPLLRADIGFRGVAVPVGLHTVEMTYRPETAVQGAAVSFVSLLSVLALLVASRARRARGPRAR